MDPNQENPNAPDPSLNTAVGASEYLDQISAKPKSSKFLDKKMLFLLGGLLLIIIIVITVIASSSKKSVDVSSVIIKAKTQYDNAMQVIDYGIKNLTPGPTARNNAIARLVIGTHASDLTGKIGKGKLSKETAATLRDPKKAQAELKTAQEAGRLNSEFKDTAGLFIQDVIDTLKVIAKTPDASKSSKEMAAKYIEELETIKSRIEE
jgi:preprotein translocase subunit SecG